LGPGHRRHAGRLYRLISASSSGPPPAPAGSR
jgi:hypothetical protein